MKKVFSVILAVVILFTLSVPSFAIENDSWDEIYNSKDAAAGIMMFVGSDESERKFSWYSSKQSEPVVLISEDKALKSADSFKGECVEAIENGFANKVTVTGLKENTTYYYQCISEGFESQIYSFKTADGVEFSALFVTDVHITAPTDDCETALYDTSYRLHETIDDALSKNKDISLLLSAGDQATDGLECEYIGFTASNLIKSLSVATAMGNHDRKGVAYKVFKNIPNEDAEASIHSYNGNDYWFTKGEALFLVMDSNSGNGAAHADFVESAIKANPDAKWKIMMFHHDLYSGRIPHRESENRLLRTIWGPIADEYGIDLVLLGHSHYYTVTDVVYKNTTVADLEEEMVDAKGAVYMVSCSLGRPRDDDEIGLNDEWIGFEYLTQNATYNILDFTEDTITVSSYELGEKKPFYSFALTKTTNDGGHEDSGFFASVKDAIVRGLGAVYTIFNNISVCNDLKEDGYEVELSDFFS